LLYAAIENYTQSGQAGDLTPFLVGGQQLQISDTSDGVVAAVWFTPSKQVIISYEGTFGNTPGGYSPSFLLTQLENDTQILASNAPVAAETAGLTFAKQVAVDAAAQGIVARNIFVTGHSLGATIASYVAEETGYGGIGFEPLGIAPAIGTKGDGGNFVAVDTYGDAVPAYASNETAIGPVAPSNQPLYGQVLHVGDPNWQTPLSIEAASYGPVIFFGGKSAQVAAELSLFGLNLLDHLPITQAHALGVPPPPATNAAGVLLNEGGNTSGPVLNVANDTIPQLIAYIKETNGYMTGMTSGRGAISLSAIDRSQIERGFVDAMASFAPRLMAGLDSSQHIQPQVGIAALAVGVGQIRLAFQSVT
jgi:hypothetical protein